MTLHDFLSDNPSGKKRQCRDRVSRGDFLSSTWVKVASASNRCRTWLSTHEARRVEVERAKGRGRLTRSVKLAQLVRGDCLQRKVSMTRLRPFSFLKNMKP